MAMNWLQQMWKKFQRESTHAGARRQPRHADRKRKSARKMAERSRQVNERPGVMMRRHCKR
jgi:hypothetical protein